METPYLPPENPDYLWKESTFGRDGSIFYLFARFTINATLHFNEQVALQFGGMLHNQPLFFGSTTIQLTCADSCVGTDLDDVVEQETTWMFTPFGSLTVQLTNWLGFTGQIFVHAAGTEQLLESFRFGGDMALRFRF